MTIEWEAMEAIAMQSKPRLSVTIVDSGLVLVLGIGPLILDCCGIAMKRGLGDHH